ncbi:MAG: NHL repeat-containing protein [Candidatus Sumerlaeia bacterium]
MKKATLCILTILLLVCLAAPSVWAADEGNLEYELVEDKDAAFEVEMDMVKSIAIGPDQKIYVAGSKGVHIFNADGERTGKIDSESPYTAIAVGDDGKVYAASRWQVNVYDKDGNKETAYGEKGRDPGQFLFITGLALKNGFIYIADAGSRRVSRFATVGDYVDYIDGFLIPSPYFDLVFDSKGMLVLGHTGKHRVEYYDANHELTKNWGQFGSNAEGFCGCCNPCNLYVMDDGRVITAEKGIPRLKIYSTDGEMLAFLGGKENFNPSTEGMDLAVDKDDRIVLLDSFQNKVRFFNIKENGASK